MPLCVKCKKSKRNRLVCLHCYNSAIEDLNQLLEHVKEELRMATIKSEFLQAMLASAYRNVTQDKKSEVITVRSGACKAPKRAQSA